MLIIQFLGTSAGLPTKQRNVSAAALKPLNKKNWILIDCGEATQHQLLHTHLSINDLDLICITHVHGDHCYGLPGLLASMVMHNRRHALHIIAPTGIEELIAAHCRLTDLQLTYDIHFHLTEELHNGMTFGDYFIERCLLSHRVPSYAYKFRYCIVDNKLNIEQLIADNIPKGALWGAIQKEQSITLEDGRHIDPQQYLQQQKHTRSVIVSGDNDTPACLDPLIEDCDALVHEATYTQMVADKVGPTPMHTSAKSIARYAQNKNIAQLILTHFSSRYQSGKRASPNILEIADEAQQHYKGQLYLANDFDCIEI